MCKTSVKASAPERFMFFAEAWPAKVVRNTGDTTGQTGDSELASYKILAEGLQFPEGPVACRDGSVLLVEIERKTVTRVSPDGTTSIVAELDGGPNGLAVGPDGCLYICNNGGFLFQPVAGFNRVKPGVPEGYAGGWIERLEPKTGERKILYTHCGEHRLVGPNDIVFDRKGGFYFTDYGKLYPRHRMNGGLYYALADGSRIVEVAYPLLMPNGVGMSPDEGTVYVAETESGRLWAFDMRSPGMAPRHSDLAPHGGRLIAGLPAYQRLDSLALDDAGNIHVATLSTGCITVVSPGGEIVEQIMTGDPMTTNVCFGGPSRRTAYVTLSGRGQLVAMDSRYRGLELAWEL
jgi:gluconolactonase